MCAFVQWIYLIPNGIQLTVNRFCFLLLIWEGDNLLWIFIDRYLPFVFAIRHSFQNKTPAYSRTQDTHTSNNPRIHLKPFCPLLNESFYLNWHSSVYTVWQEWRWGVRGLQVSAFLWGKEEKRQASTPAANDDDDDTKKTAESNWGWLPGSFPLQEEKPFFVNNSSTCPTFFAWWKCCVMLGKSSVVQYNFCWLSL